MLRRSLGCAALVAAGSMSLAEGLDCTKVDDKSGLPFSRCLAYPTAAEPGKGVIFDDWQELALKGAITEVCWSMGRVNGIYYGRRVLGFHAVYAGQPRPHLGAKRGADQTYCWKLEDDEVLTTMVINYFNHGDVTDNGNIIVNLKFCTNKNRCSKKFGGNDWKNQHTLTMKCPKAGNAEQHFMGFHGRYTKPGSAWAGDMRRLGVYCGFGGGEGGWELVDHSPSDVKEYTVTKTRCSKISSETKHEVTKEWGFSASLELSWAFPAKVLSPEVMPDVPPVRRLGDDGPTDGGKVNFEGHMSRSVVDSLTTSFESTECQAKTMKGIKPHREIYQWRMRSRFWGNLGPSVDTYSEYIAVVPTGTAPCCPPGTYTDDYAQKCKKEVFLCKGRKALSGDGEVESMAPKAGDALDLPLGLARAATSPPRALAVPSSGVALAGICAVAAAAAVGTATYRRLSGSGGASARALTADDPEEPMMTE